MQLDLNLGFKVQELQVKFKPRRSKSPASVHTPDEVHALLGPLLADDPREKFVGLLIGPANQVIGMEVISQGTSDAALVSPREVFKAALLTNSDALILAHNHPSGNHEPSDNDRAVALNLQQAARILDVRLLDFMVITRKRYFSFAQSDPEFNIGPELKNKGGD